MSQKIKHSLEQPNSRKRAPMIAFLFILALIVLTACTTAPTPTTSLPIPTDLPQTATPTDLPRTATSTPNLPTPIPSPTIPTDWQYRWLKKIPCSAPCVEGITPGKTTATEAVEILNRNPLVENVQKDPDYFVQLKLGRVSWDWLGSRRSSSGAAIYSTDTSEVILSIVPQFGKSYALREVMQTYGEPTYIIADAHIPASEKIVLCQRVKIIYVSYGFELHYENCQTKIELDENLSFSNIIFFVPTREGYYSIDSTAKKHPDWMLPWQGFKGFEYYCHDEFNGKLCRGEIP
jgi:hypothetical protein